MENYKRKNPKFSGLGKSIRAAELDAARRSSRLQRFSLLRPNDDDVPIEEPKETLPIRQIPTLGIQKPTSRLDMLKKWKMEKELKKKVELQSKKPPFKAGSNFNPSIPSTLLFNKSDRLGESSRAQDSSFQPFSIKLQTSVSKSLQAAPKIQHNIKTSSGIKSKSLQAAPKFQHNLKMSSGIKSKDIGAKSNTVESQATVTKPTIKSKVIPHNAVPKPAVRKPEISLLPPRNQIPNTKAKGQIPTSQSNSQASTKPKGPTVGNRSNSQLQSTKIKGQTLTCQSNSQASIKLKGPTVGNRSNPQTSTIKQNCPQLGNRLNPVKQPSKFNKPNIKNSIPVTKSTKPVPDKQPVPAFRKPAEKSIPIQAQPKKTQKPEEAEKSFAPKGFKFCPPTGLSFMSFMDDESPCSILEKVKGEMKEKIRTSTPKKLEWGEVQDARSSTDLIPSFTVESSLILATSTSVCSFIPSDTKSPDKDPPVVKLSDHTCPKIKVLEQEKALENVPLEEICPEISLENKLSETLPLEKMHPHHNSLKSDMLEPKPFDETSSNTKDSHMNSLVLPPEMDLKKTCLCQKASTEVCLPVSNETTSALCISKDVATRTSDLEIDQAKSITSETFLLEKVPVKSTATELSISETIEKETAFEFPLLEKDLGNTPVHQLVLCKEDQLEKNSDVCLPVMEQATGDSIAMVNESEKNERNQVFRPSLSFLHGTEKTKRFTRSHRRMEPCLLQISESPEMVETPKSLRKSRKDGGSAREDFTPRRSRRLARLSVFNSNENLFDIEASFLYSPGQETSKLTYSFENLHLESSKDITDKPSNRMSTRSSSADNGRVSLLYTPPRIRKSTRNKSIRGDLITFSPNI